MKKSISWILLTILLSFQISAIAEESQEIFSESAEINQEEQANEYEQYSSCVEFVKLLGIMPEQVFEENLYVTRGEFADYINNILFSGDGEAEAQAWVEEVFKEDKIDEIVVPSVITDTFTDVSRNHMYYDEIEKVNQFSVMKGTGNDTFSPDEKITFSEVGTAMIRLLGYGVKAKITSYESTALELGIFNGIEYAQNDEITKYELAKVFYNCSDIELMKADIDYGKAEYAVSDENFLENYMDIYKDKGQVISNSFTSVYTKKGAGKNKAIINGIVYNIEKTEYLNDYIGREVEYYYFDDDEIEYPQILIARTTDKDEIIKIQAEDVVNLKDYRLTYETDKKTLYKKIKQGASLIYNGIYMSNYTSEMFKFENGDVTLIKSRKSSEFDILIVNNYISYYIAEINKDDGILYGKTSDKSDVTTIDVLRKDMDEYKVRIYRQDGSRASIDDISRGMICDVAQNDTYIKIILPIENVHTLIVKKIGELNGKATVADAEGNSFEFLKSYYDATEDKRPILNESYVIYLNSFGKIVWIKSTSDEKNSKIHYLIKAVDDEQDGEGGYIRLLDSKGVIATYHVMFGAKIKNKDNETIKLKDGISLEGIIDGYSGVVDVDINESNEVTRIEIPQKNMNVERNGRLGIFEENEKVYWCGQGSDKHFENAMLSSNVVLFYTDTSKSDENDKYRVIDQSAFKSGNTYQIKAYNYKSESIISDCIVISGKLTKNIDDNNKKMYIVESISETLNDDEPIVKIECDGISANTKMTDVSLMFKSGIGAYAETFFDADANIAIKKGDIIYCEFEDDYVARAVLVYRVFNEDNESNLQGTTGAYTPSVSNATNPYAVGGTGAIETSVNSITKLRPALTRFFAGYVYKLEDDKYLTYTTMPLLASSKFNRNNLDSKYLAETIVMPKNYVVINVHNNRMEVLEGDISGIKTFCNSGAARSEIFVNTRYGVAWNLVFINRY